MPPVERLQSEAMNMFVEEFQENELSVNTGSRCTIERLATS